MIMHPAVCIMRLLRSSADVMILPASDEREAVGDGCTKFGSGRERCRLNWLSLANMEGGQRFAMQWFVEEREGTDARVHSEHK